MQLIPAIDLRRGQCVRLYQGNFDAEMPYASSPEALYDLYAEGGATWLHVVDLDGARLGAPVQLGTISALARRGRLKLQVAGGFRDVDSPDWALDAGVARVVIGSCAVTHPELVSAWLTRLGPERLAVALDVMIDQAGQTRLAIRGWRELTTITLWELLERYADMGLTHVLCTDIARDGTLGGPNLDLYAKAVRAQPSMAWQAAGGVRDGADLTALAATGVAAAVSGRALLEDRMRLKELQPFLLDA